MAGVGGFVLCHGGELRVGTLGAPNSRRLVWSSGAVAIVEYLKFNPTSKIKILPNVKSVFVGGLVVTC